MVVMMKTIVENRARSCWKYEGNDRDASPNAAPVRRLYRVGTGFSPL
jgi:hypothetical protein